MLSCMQDVGRQGQFRARTRAEAGSAELGGELLVIMLHSPDLPRIAGGGGYGCRWPSANEGKPQLYQQQP